MERLTKYGKTSHENGVCCTHFCSKECHEVAGECAHGCKWEEEVWSKLAKYEDLEEQGRLLKLPCKVGDKAYHVIEDHIAEPPIYISEHEIKDVSAKAVYFADEWWSFEEMDKLNAFLSKEEAEKRLAEMEDVLNAKIVHVVILDLYKLMGRKNCEIRYASSSGNFEALKYQAKLRNITLTPITFEECLDHIRKNLVVRPPMDY